MIKWQREYCISPKLLFLIKLSDLPVCCPFTSLRKRRKSAENRSSHTDQIVVMFVDIIIPPFLLTWPQKCWLRPPPNSKKREIFKRDYLWRGCTAATRCKAGSCVRLKRTTSVSASCFHAITWYLSKFLSNFKCLPQCLSNYEISILTNCVQVRNFTTSFQKLYNENWLWPTNVGYKSSVPIFMRNST